MTGTFGTVIIIIVTGLTIGLVVPMMMNLILKEVENYQIRKNNRAMKNAAEILRLFSEYLNTLKDKVQEMTTNGKKSV